jgi:hypothetical protein
MATRELRAAAWVAGRLLLLLLTRGAGGIREGERCRGWRSATARRLKMN